jgi:hypothetical protein
LFRDAARRGGRFVGGCDLAIEFAALHCDPEPPPLPGPAGGGGGGGSGAPAATAWAKGTAAGSAGPSGGGRASFDLDEMLQWSRENS